MHAAARQTGLRVRIPGNKQKRTPTPRHTDPWCLAFGRTGGFATPHLGPRPRGVEAPPPILGGTPGVPCWLPLQEDAGAGLERAWEPVVWTLGQSRPQPLCRPPWGGRSPRDRVAASPLGWGPEAMGFVEPGLRRRLPWGLCPPGLLSAPSRPRGSFGRMRLAPAARGARAGRNGIRKRAPHGREQRRSLGVFTGATKAPEMEAGTGRTRPSVSRGPAKGHGALGSPKTPVVLLLAPEVEGVGPSAGLDAERGALGSPCRAHCPVPATRSVGLCVDRGGSGGSSGHGRQRSPSAGFERQRIRNRDC